MNSTTIAPKQAKPSPNHNQNEENKTQTAQNSQTLVTTLAVDDATPPATTDSTAAPPSSMQGTNPGLWQNNNLIFPGPSTRFVISR